MTYLFLFTIGPVQSFIARARKTRDLFAGSQILSELVKKGLHACEVAAAEAGATMDRIFPDFDIEEKYPSLPNRFIVKLSFSGEPSQEVFHRIAGNAKGGVEYVVRDHFMTIARKALRRAGITHEPEGFMSQLEKHLDIYWAFQPLKEGKYRETYLALEGLIGAIKNVRQFGQILYPEQAYGELGRKCSIDGEGNALFYRGRQNSNEPPAMLKHNNLGNESDLTKKLDSSEWDDGEALSGISTVKRLYGRGEDKFDKYPSTSRIALMNSLANNMGAVERLRVAFGKENLGNLIKDSENLQIKNTDDWASWNDQFFYEENLTNQNISNPTQLELAKKRLKELKDSGFSFDKYYAVIVFDGDRMGKWLSGENTATTDLESFHKHLSNKLSEFARTARAIIDDNGWGKTVYAGGDDFLGFVNIHYLFDAIKSLRETFDNFVNKAIELYKKPGRHLTFSAGVVVAHYKMPFSEVLKKARDVEKSAKNEGTRNAFGIAVMKHSGEIQQAIYKWDGDDESASGCSNWEALKAIYQSIDKDEGDFSNTFIQNLSVEISRLSGVEMSNFSNESSGAKVNQIIPLEIKRLINRAWKEGKEKDDDKVKSLTLETVRLWENVPHGSDHRPRNFVHALHIADFLNRKIEQEP